MKPRLRLPFLSRHRSYASYPSRDIILRQPLIAAPRANSGPLLTRRSDRALPIPEPSWMVWARTFPLFILAMIACTLAIFNYEKSCSSVVAAILYALRTSEIGKRELGEEIYFRDKVPWIWGELNPVHGKINLSFGVKGTKGKGFMRFRSERIRGMKKFETIEWSLETEDGRKLQLLDEGKADPFENTAVNRGGSN